MNRNEETIGNEEPQNENKEDTSPHPMDAFLDEEAYGLDSPRRGEVRTGTIARITESDILVDIGYKSEGLIPGRELERLPEEKRDELVVGKEVTVYVLRAGGTDGTILLSIARAEEERDWLEAERLLKTKEIFEGVISGYNKGGLIVKLGRLRGFIPASQVSMARRWRSDGDSAEQRWGKMVGEPIVSKVIEVERRRNRLILSERAAAREARDVLKERLIEELQPGEIRTGHVISLADFGAFVDIGGADGLVHTSEISWKRINHPRDVLKVGQEVKVKVLGVDPEQKRISLSLRELEEDPWDKIVQQYKEGQLVEGTITKLTKFGAFASLKGVDDYELEGLVHISELSDRHIVHPREVVSENETLTLRVIKVDRKRRRIGLSLKKVDSPEYAELDWQTAMEELHAGDEEGEASEEEGITIKSAAAEELVEGEKEATLVEEIDKEMSSTELDVELEGEVEGEVEQDLLPESEQPQVSTETAEEQPEERPDTDTDSLLENDVHEGGEMSPKEEPSDNHSEARSDLKEPSQQSRAVLAEEEAMAKEPDPEEMEKAPEEIELEGDPGSSG
jgi:small subunit ribosomal protein S1